MGVSLLRVQPALCFSEASQQESRHLGRGGGESLKKAHANPVKVGSPVQTKRSQVPVACCHCWALWHALMLALKLISLGCTWPEAMLRLGPMAGNSKPSKHKAFNQPQGM